MSVMPEILAVVVDSPERAHEILHATLDRPDQGALVVHDAVIVARNATGRDDDAIDPVPVTVAVTSSLLGALIGAVAAGPLGFLVGGALAGGAAATLAKMAEGWFTRDALAEARTLAERGGCVLALLVDQADDKARAELAAIAGSQPVRLHAA
jgi:uncharacterized membrane protein